MLFAEARLKENPKSVLFKRFKLQSCLFTASIHDSAARSIRLGTLIFRSSRAGVRRPPETTQSRAADLMSTMAMIKLCSNKQETECVCFQQKISNK